MSPDLLPIQPNIELHLQHKYNFRFKEVVSAFIRKYNTESSMTTTTIASTRQIDEDRFEIIRRMENIMTSKPLYERIIFDRKTKSI
eukprot:CAMPEP_0202965582 /NCGR_PEP_ID=MMETSP1396-20130829/9507_1 /ASSEMBLY_ACC=CAM_ASM_000872 /TAXON_ID= /ORGANISM="Pseudokeronopsis sp., Strain Brazil" /LENGTH=85 /DNA_ID=CAMNT_0049688337 /DNA_START=9 /DNA_END=266 /DNA_ORIENTATION=+